MVRIGPGARVADRYVVLEELGGGGMGVVYLARDEAEAREVAIKVLREAPRGEAARRLRREARATSSLDPERVARVYDVGETPDGELYLVMEYVRGSTLRALLREGRVARLEALRIIREVAATLGEAHRAGLVHRDVKPDNVIIGAHGRVVLLDFGLVKHLEAGDDTAHLSTQLTSEGTLLGTPAYLAPEQALGREIGPEADQFALAVTAFELLTGKLPWTASEVTRMLAQVLGETPPPASTVDRMLQPAFDAVLSRALSKDPAGRFPTVEDFARALDAAERGEYVLSPASQTVSAPMPARTGTLPQIERARASRSRPWIAGVVGVLALSAAAAGVLARCPSRAALPVANTLEKTAAALATPSARLACPILEVRGIPDVTVRLGAAAATLACSRVKWYLGGRDDRTLPPAALLDMPTQPVEGFSDPYIDPAQRERTIELARARGTAYLDGRLTHERGSWLVEISLRAPDALEIARAEGRDDAEIGVAVKRATEGLWSAPPLVRVPLDSDVARWTSFPDADTGLLYTDLLQRGASSDACDAVTRRAKGLGSPFYRLEGTCRTFGLSMTTADAGQPLITESSGSALVASVEAALAWRMPIPIDEERRLATELNGLLGAEKSPFARANLADAAGVLWTMAREPEQAHSALLSAVRDDPQSLEAWHHLTAAAADTGSRSPSAALAAAWFPSEPAFLIGAFSSRTDELEARLRETRLAYLIEPTLVRAIYLGRALAEAGRSDEVRAVAAAPNGGTTPSHNLETYLLALLDLHDAKLDRGLERLGGTVQIGLIDMVVVAGVLGRTGAVATSWAEKFLALPNDEAAVALGPTVAPVALCMHARRDVARRCVERVAAIEAGWHDAWGVGGDVFSHGARFYAEGDVRAAVATWRPLVAGPTLDIVRMLPTDAFERAGEPNLAARLDARKMSFANVAGVSDAAPREAKRALAAGDKARAKELAQKVVTAWEVADVAIPAVVEMRGLLKTIDH